MPLNDRSFLMPQLSIPVLAYIHRKPGLTLDEAFLDDLYQGNRSDLLKYGRWQTLFDDWTAIDIRLLYRYSINDRLSVSSQLGFHYYAISFPEKVTNINVPWIWYLNYHF